MSTFLYVVCVTIAVNQLQQSAASSNEDLAKYWTDNFINVSVDNLTSNVIWTWSALSFSYFF